MRRSALARSWSVFVRRSGAYQSTILLTIVYVALLGPGVLIARVTGSRLLDLDTRTRPSYWIARAPIERTRTALERQF